MNVFKAPILYFRQYLLFLFYMIYYQGVDNFGSSGINSGFKGKAGIDGQFGGTGDQSGNDGQLGKDGIQSGFEGQSKVLAQLHVRQHNKVTNENSKNFIVDSLLLSVLDCCFTITYIAKLLQRLCIPCIVKTISF